jgi:hypothetical protein
VTWVAIAAAVLVLAGCGGADDDAVTESTVSATRAGVRAALAARLTTKKLSYHWIVCVRTHRDVGGQPLFRCNVNFGEPHIVRYCATVEDGSLVTNHERPELRCGRRRSQAP